MSTGKPVAGWPGAMPAAVDTSTAKTSEERRTILATHIAASVAHGARIESQSDYQAVLVYGKRVNHVLHLLLSVLLLGLWLIVWLFLALTGGEKRELVQVDDFGNVTRQRV